MPDDFKANPRTKGTVAVGGSATGEIETAKDVDWFAVELVAGRAYVIDLEGSDTGGGTLASTMLHGLFDGDGNRVARREHNGAEGGSARMTYTATEDGTHYIAAKGYRKEHTGTYTVRVRERDPDAVAAGAADLGELTGERLVRQDSVDRREDAADYYRFTLSETQAVTLSLRRQDANADLYLEDADGNVLHSSTRGGTRPEEIAATLEAGTYYVRVAARKAGDNDYWLRARAEDPPPVVLASVPEPEGEDFPADTSTAGRVLVGGSVTGEVGHREDRDWFAVTLEKDKAYRIDLKGGTLQDPYLHGIHDANGNLIAGTENDDGYPGSSRDSLVFFTPAESGTYYVAAGSYVSVFPHRSFIGTYTLSVEEFADDFVASTDTTGTVAVGGSVTGEVGHRGDRDWFAVTLEKDKVYRIDLKGGTLNDPYLHGIHDATGNLVAGTETDDSHPRGNRDSRVFFTPAESGTYYVAAGGFWPNTGTYTLSVEVVDDFATDKTSAGSEPEGEDLPADTSTAGRVAVGDSVTGEVDQRGDRDWFAVTLEKDKAYRIDLKGGTLKDPYLYGIHDADGNLLADTANNNGHFGGYRDSLVFFTPAESGTYYVAAGGFEPQSIHRSFIGTYTLSVEEFADDFAASTDTTGTVAVGGSATGEVGHRGDRDWFAVSLEKDKVYRIDLKGGTLKDPYLGGIHDADGNLIAGTENDDGYPGSNRDSRAFFTPAESGTFYVAAGGLWRYTGTYTLSVEEVVDDFAADTDTAGTVAVGGSATGAIDYWGDRDWFAVTLEKDKLYRIDQTGDATWVPDLHGIHDANGNLVAGTENDDGDSDSRWLEFTAAESGTHYMAAGGRGDLTGTYTLSVVADDFAADKTTTGAVKVGGSATGTIDWAGRVPRHGPVEYPLPGTDRDWFAVTLTAEILYRFDLRGSSSGGGTLRDPLVMIYNADGGRGGIDIQGGEGLDSRMYFRPGETGTYYVAATAFQGYIGNDTGTYTLEVQALDDFAASTRTTGTVAPGGSVVGEINDLNDADWFAVTLEKGKAYRIEMKGTQTGDGSLEHPILGGIRDATGAPIAGTADHHARWRGTNSEVHFTPTETATYYVEADAWGSMTGTYTLAVTEVADDFTADTDTAGTVAVGGSATGEIEYPDDRDWFAVTLEKGETYRFQMKGSGTGDGTLQRTRLYGIHDADGDLVQDGPGYNSWARWLNYVDSMTFTPVEDATYYVAAASWTRGVGTYTLDVDAI